MRNKYIHLIFLLISASFLYSDPTLPGVIAATDGDPGVLIAGSVNAITGDLVHGNEDLVIQGAVPLVIRKCYVSGNGTGYNSGWQFLPHFTLIIQAYEQPKYCDFYVTEPSGGTMRYFCDTWLYKHIELRPIFSKHAIGMTNNASGVISGRTNLNNYRLISSKKHKKDSFNNLKDLYVRTGDGLRRYYNWGYSTNGGYTMKFVLTKEELPNGCWILYDHDAWGRPTKARTVNPNCSKTFAWANFHYHGGAKDNHNFTIETSDGRNLHYHFERQGKFQEDFRFLLREVEGAIPVNQSYTYGQGKHLLPLVAEIKNRGHVIQKMTYQGLNKAQGIKHAAHPACNRVKELWEPAGPQGTLIRTYHFDYHLGEWQGDYSGFNKKGTSFVDGPDGFKETILWSRQLRPLETTFFDTYHSSDPQIIHKFEWGKEKTKEVGSLKKRILCNGNHQMIHATGFGYDGRYNPMYRTFQGVLSGTRGEETYNHHYRYSDDHRNLLLEDREDNGKVVKYRYLHESSRLMGVFTGDSHTIYQRKFYEYDHDYLLVTEITDDGKTEDITNFQGMTTRHLKRMYRRADGMVERIEERYWDAVSGGEKLLKGIIQHYSDTLRLTRQDIHDADWNFLYSIFFEYDQFGRVTGQTDPLGRWARSTYDEMGRVSTVIDPSGLLTTHNHYDRMDRLAQVDQVTLDGQKHSEYFHYNNSGVKTASIDYLGNMVKYHPDAFGRNKRIEYPNRAPEDFTYDAMGNPTTKTGYQGGVTQTIYNAYGKPLQVSHPDGTQESFIYNLDGTVKETIDKLGAHTYFTYDVLGRVTHKRVQGPNGHLLTEESNIYDSFQLIEQIDAQGNSTKFTYDGAGRKIAEYKNGALTQFTYDTRGKLATTTTEEWVQEFEYDMLGNTIAERTLSLDGNLQREVTYAYDSRGNRSEMSVTTSQGKSTEHMFYDSFNRLITKIDPTGATTEITYDESERGLLRKIATDPLGTKTIETIGPMEKRLSLEIITRFGERLSFEEFIYDEGGNLHLHHSHLPGRTITTLREYDQASRIVLLQEGHGTPEAKTTRYAYNSQGLLSDVFKNDGEILHHEYDALGRMILCVALSGDGYRYTYDRLSRLTQVEDLGSGLISFRSYDMTGQIEQETFLHGLSVSYDRDARGRPILMTLPDSTGIGYHWDATRLKSIFRLSQDGTIRYTHTYEKHDLSGYPILSSLIGGAGTETRHYDIRGKLSRCATKWHEEIAEERDEMGHLTQVATNFPFYKDHASFKYDAIQQLKEERSKGFAHTFLFDAHSTLLERDNKKSDTNALYQVLSLDNKKYDYDLAGRRCGNQEKIYRYDAFDRLITIMEPGVQRTEYAYDSWHRRVQKTVYVLDGWINKEWKLKESRSFFYDGMIEIGATDEEGRIVELRVLGATPQAEAGATIAIELNQKVYTPLHDIKGHIVGLVNPETQDLVEFYRYSAFGEVRIFSKKGWELSYSYLGNPWYYFGKRRDPESDLYYFGRRYYQATLGQWITPDPAGSIDRPNLYAFLRGNPLSFYDPIGLASREPHPWNRELREASTPVSRALDATFAPVIHGLGHAIYYTSYHLPVPIVRDGLVNVGSYMSGNPNLAGVQHSKVTCVGGSSQQPRYRNIFMNGILNTCAQAKDSALNISKGLDNESVILAYNASHGIGVDLIDCCLEKMGVNTHPARLLDKTIRREYNDLLKQFPDQNFDINVFLHSEGNLHGEIALEKIKKTNPEISNHISVYSFGSPVIFDRNLAGGIEMWISKYDGVGWIDFMGRMQNHDHVHIIESKGGFPGLDHALLGDTYREQLDNVCDKIKGKWIQ